MIIKFNNKVLKYEDKWINGIVSPGPTTWQRAYAGTPISNKDTGLFLETSNSHVSLDGNYNSTITWDSDYGSTLPSSLTEGTVRECTHGTGIKITFNDMIFPTWNKQIMFRLLFNVVAVSSRTSYYDMRWDNGRVGFDDNILTTRVNLSTDVVTKPNGYLENKLTRFSGLTDFNLPNHYYKDDIEIRANEIGANINELRWYINENESHIEIRNPSISNPIIIPISTVANDLNQDGYIKPVTLDLKSMNYYGYDTTGYYWNTSIKFGYVDVFIPTNGQPIGELFDGDWIVNCSST